MQLDRDKKTISKEEGWNYGLAANLNKDEEERSSNQQRKWMEWSGS